MCIYTCIYVYIFIHIYIYKKIDAFVEDKEKKEKKKGKKIDTCVKDKEKKKSILSFQLCQGHAYINTYKSTTAPIHLHIYIKIDDCIQSIFFKFVKHNNSTT